MCHRSTAIANQAEKRQRGFDKSVDEWRRKLADVQAELERSLADGRSSNSDSFRMRAQLDETHESIEAPFALSQPEGWLGQSLDEVPIKSRSGRCKCVKALNDPVFW